MSSVRARSVQIGLAAIALTAAGATLWLTNSQAGLVAGLSAGPTPPPIVHADPRIDVRAAVQFPPTGGPYLSESDAIAAATKLAAGPITRRASGFLTYGTAAAWMGSTTFTIDPQREFYLVVSEGRYVGRRGAVPVTCSVYFALVDATTGAVMANGCKDFTGRWPALPPSVSEK